MGNGNFWQLFLGKEPYSKKSDFVKAWLLWWAITILVLFILSLTTTLNLRSIGIGLSFGFCQILGRYTMSLGWSKYWGVLGVLPVTNIVLFSYLNFFQKKINKSVGRLIKRPTHVNS
ncbi:Inner membrane protein [Escherichia coli]|nr:hypothetical protein [Escherichia coli]HDR9928135.1 hypothetical protein [Escherichia coli 3350-73 (13a)]